MAGISLAPDDGALVASPTWERIDLNYNVQSWSIDRGRPTEMSRTDTGTATIELVDRNGDWDPTNASGAFFGRLVSGHPMGPMVQAKIELQNPITLAWATLFRGFIGSLQWVPYRSEQHANVTLELVDAFALLAACEMAADGTHGHSVEDGNIIFNEDLTLDAPKTRIGKVLDDFGWPGTLRTLFTANVALQRTVYAPRTTLLTVLRDAADAEFPDVSNLFVSGPARPSTPPGSIVFHGRYARFDPTNPDYELETWQLGDDAAAGADPTNVVRISPPLVASIDDAYLFTSAYAMPAPDPTNDFTQSDYAAQYSEDSTAAGLRGLRTWTAEGLLTFGGEGGTTALEETKLMANYVRDNYPISRVRVGQVTIKSQRHDGPYGPAAWALLTGIDISDVVHLTTTHGGGGGFDDDFYVEGIHYQARPGGGVPYVELVLDVSPRGYYIAGFAP